MELGQTLIDKAADLCGSRYKLAKRLGVSQSTLSVMASGKKPLSPGLAGRIADVAGLDAKEAALTALIAQEKDEAAKLELCRVFGVAPVPMADARAPRGLRTLP